MKLRLKPAIAYSILHISQLQQCRDDLETLREEDGTWLALFNRRLENREGEYAAINLEPDGRAYPNQRAAFQQVRTELLNALLRQLDHRFSHVELLNAMQVGEFLNEVPIPCCWDLLFILRDVQKSKEWIFSNATFCISVCWYTNKTRMVLRPRFSSQHWYRLWLGSMRQQAITWANVDQDPCRHMASLDPNELMRDCSCCFQIFDVHEYPENIDELTYWGQQHLQTLLDFYGERKVNSAGAPFDPLTDEAGRQVDLLAITGQFLVFKRRIWENRYLIWILKWNSNLW